MYLKGKHEFYLKVQPSKYNSENNEMHTILFLLLSSWNFKVIMLFVFELFNLFLVMSFLISLSAGLGQCVNEMVILCFL